MKRIIAAILANILILSACASQPDCEPGLSSGPSQASVEEFRGRGAAAGEPRPEEPGVIENAGKQENVPEFDGMDDPRFLQYVEDAVYERLEDEFSKEGYSVESVNAVYYSKEYLEEVVYNSKANVFFGYTLAELDELFRGERYVFTLSDDGGTTAEAFEPYEDTMEKYIAGGAAAGVVLVLAAVTYTNPAGVVMAGHAIVQLAVRHQKLIKVGVMVGQYVIDDLVAPAFTSAVGNVWEGDLRAFRDRFR